MSSYEKKDINNVLQRAFECVAQGNAVCIPSNFICVLIENKLNDELDLLKFIYNFDEKGKVYWNFFGIPLKPKKTCLHKLFLLIYHYKFITLLLVVLTYYYIVRLL
jgi:hypothetical protein